MSSSSDPAKAVANGTKVQDSTKDARRPLGVLIFSLLLILGGLGLVSQRIHWLVRILGDGATIVRVDPAIYVSITGEAITATTGIIGAIAMLLGKRVGWWLAMAHLYWRLSRESILPILGWLVAWLSDKSASVEQGAMTRGTLFVGLAVLYLMKLNVVTYFGIAPSNRLTANLAALLLAILLALGLDWCWIAVDRV